MEQMKFYDTCDKEIVGKSTPRKRGGGEGKIGHIHFFPISLVILLNILLQVTLSDMLQHMQNRTTIPKTVSFSKEEIDILEKVKEEHGFHSFSAAIAFIINSYAKTP